MQFRNFYEELKRRNVFRVGMVYGVTAWLMIQVIDTVFPILELPEWTVTLLTVVILTGFPFALIFAWAFELTPEGLKRSEEVVDETSISGQTGKKINRITVVSLSLIIIFLLTERVFFAGNGSTSERPAAIGEASIAVLPFVNISSDPDNEYFSDGLSEELLNVLAKVEDLKVAGRTSSFKFKGENDDLKLIGSELGVNHILEGSVRKSGDQIRITVQLINVEDGYHMWSETYDRKLTDIFEIQDEISRRVLDELKIRLLEKDAEPVLQIPTRDFEAYEAYLRANHLMLDRQPEKMQTAVGLYENAIRLDPTFAQAYARLAIAHHLINYYGVGDFEEKQKLLKQNAETAISLNDELGEAYAGLGLYYSISDNELSTEYYLKSLELNENQPDVYGWLGNNYESAGMITEQNKAYLRMYELDPLAPLSMYNRSRVYYSNNELQEAEQLLRKSIRLNPGFTAAYRLISQIMIKREGRYDKALIMTHESMDLSNPSVVLLFDIVTHAFELGMTDVVEKYMNEIMKKFPQSRESGISSSLYAILQGDPDMYENSVLDLVEQFDVTVPELQFYTSLYAYVEMGGDPERAKAQFRKFDPGILSDTLISVNLKQYQLAGPLLGILYVSGDTEEFNRLRDAFCSFGERIMQMLPEGKESREYVMNRMICHLSKGDKDAAYPFFSALYTDMSPSNFNYYLLENAQLINSAMDDVRYAAIRDEYRKHVEEQRTKVREYFEGLKEN